MEHHPVVGSLRGLRRRGVVWLALIATAVGLWGLAADARAAGAAEAPFRTIITSNAEEDDVASFHRLLLHMNDMRDSVEAIVYSSSRFHWAGDPTADPPIAERDWAGTEVYSGIINGTGSPFGAGGGYKAVVDNLRWHDPRYPTVEHMNRLIKVGNITNVGEYAKDTEGSDFIKQVLLDDDPRPVFLQAWGGTNTIAAALRSIEDEYEGTPQWEAVRKRVSAKARVYIVLDQDATYREYIGPNWPDVTVIVNRSQFLAVAYGAWRYGPRTGGPYVPRPIEDAFNKGPFMSRIKVGPLMSSYPQASDAHMFPAETPDEFLSEGDSPAYFTLLPNGLRSWESPAFGGWGGRFVEARQNRWTDEPAYIADPTATTDPKDPTRVRDENPFDPQYAPAWPQARWIQALQEEVAARSQWQTATPSDANHPPVVTTADGKVDLEASPGQTVRLAGAVSDPDGDAYATTWWQYREAGTYPGNVAIADPDALATSFVVPGDARPGQTIHTILEVRDRASFPMTRYVRVITTVREPATSGPPTTPTVPGTPGGPPAGPVGPGAPPAVAIDRRVRIVGSGLRVDRRRLVRLRITCGPSTRSRCRGVVQLRAGGRVIARRSLSVAAGRPATVKLRITRSAYRRLGKGALRVTAVVSTRGSDGVLRRAQARLRLRR